MKRIISITLAFLMITSSAFAQNYETEYFDAPSDYAVSLSDVAVPTLEKGSIAIEAEDLEYSSDAKIVSDSGASGGYALTCSQKKYANAPEDVENVTMSLKIDVPVSKIGRYYLWCRLKTPKAGLSYFESFDASSTYQTRWFSQRSDYYWVKLSTISASGGIFEYNIKYRDYAFCLDKFIFTNDGSFSPNGKDDLPAELLGIEKDPIAPLPPVTPPAGVHPRVLFQAKDIPQIKANAKHPVLSTIYAQIKEYAFKNIDCHMPDKGGENNVSISHAFAIQCRALMYALGEADENHAKQTIEHMKDMFDTLVWAPAGDITRSMGTVLAVSGCVYDWCFDVLTEEDKEYFIIEMKKLASRMEIGFPAGMGETFAGHGGEGELFYFQSTAGIAIYDEDPRMYNAAAGVLYEYMFETRRAFNSAGIHPAGSAYGPVRAMWEVVGQLVFERMGDHSVMGDEFDKIPLTSIHMRQPNGLYVEDGDTWIGVPASGPYYSGNDLPLMMYSSYYDNPYVYGEAVKQLSLRNYGGATSIYDNAVLTLLFLNPNKEFAYPDDYGKEEPLTHFTSYPITTMNARTSWRQGMLGETAQVFVNGQEKLVGDHDHEHSDIGGFSIYYKGLLTSGGGTYSGPEGGWGIPHYYNYYRRTVSKNCVTVYDPNETFKISGYPLNYTLANDGGQRFEENTNTYDEFVSHKDHAKTDSAYAGPNKATPEFSYLKTDLTDAYTEKIAGYTRSTVALNLFNTDYPLVFICYDNISSSDASFKKTWNLQSIDIEPVTDGNITTIERDSYGYTGKLVVNTMLPDLSNAVFTNVGGRGSESLSGGVNYPNWETGNEQGLWRMELSPKNASKDDVFLNAMFVTDKTKNLPNLPMTKYETDKFYGVGVMDRLVFFSKKREMTTESFTLNVPQSEYDETCVLITDVAKGKWQVTGSGVNTVAEVSEEENTIYLRLEEGDYTFAKVSDSQEAVAIDYPRDERVLRVGDVLVYNTSEERFSYTQDPTAARDNYPFFSEDDFRANGATVTVSGDKVTITNGENQTILTIGSKTAIKNGASIKNKTAPFVGDNGKIYINALENKRILGMNTSYDSFSRILKVSNASIPDGTINLSLLDGVVNNTQHSSNYSPYTLSGTTITVRTDTTLEEGEKIVYFQNGVEVGNQSSAGVFTFESVPGKNRLQAKIMYGEKVVASSDIIEKTFTPIVEEKVLYTHDLTEWGTNMFYYNQQAYQTFVYDPAVSEPDENTRKVLKVAKPAGTSISSVFLQIDAGASKRDYFTFEETGSGITKIDYKIYVENTVDKIDLGNLYFAKGTETIKNNYNLYIDEPGGSIVGNVRIRSKVIPKGKWVDVSIVVDGDNKVYDITVDGTQVTTGRGFGTNPDDESQVYLKTYILPSPLSTKGDLVYYLKDARISKCRASGLFVTPACKDAKVVAGSKVAIDVETTYENADIVYYCNGIRYTDNKVVASFGTNTVYAEAIDESGNVLETSNSVTFEAYYDDFNVSFSRPDVSKVTSGEYIRTKNLFPGITFLPRLYYQSVDVTIDEGQTLNVRVGSRIVSYKSKTDYNSAEVWPVFFKFTADTIEIATTVTDSMIRDRYIEIPRKGGKSTYNLKTIYDPLYGSYILLVDDVVYSVVDVSSTKGKTTDLTPRQTDINTYGFLFYQVSSPQLFSNYEIGYSTLPEVRSKIEYINNGQIITKRSHVSASHDLTVKFVAIKSETENVLCVATVIDDAGKLRCVATKNVTFDETKDSEEVTLDLENLPSDIASGEYTVNVMLWDGDTFAPIVPKTSMP